MDWGPAAMSVLDLCLGRSAVPAQLAQRAQQAHLAEAA